MRYKKLITHVESHTSAVSLPESGVERCIKTVNINSNCLLQDSRLLSQS